MTRKSELTSTTIFNGKVTNKADRYGWDVRGRPGRLEWIKKERLLVADEYQRGLVESKLSKITAEFDWALFGVLSVAQREDGTLFVTDGQHRLLSTMRHDKIEKVPCYITPVDSMSEEAKMFLGLNTLRKPVTSFDKFKAMSVAEDGDAAFVREFLESRGLTVISEHGDIGPKKVRCIAALLTLAKESRETFMTVVRVADSFFGNRAGMTAMTVNGLAWLHSNLTEGIESKRFMDRLNMFSPADLDEALRKARVYHGVGGARIYGDGILSLVNKGLRIRFETKTD